MGEGGRRKEKGGGGWLMVTLDAAKFWCKKLSDEPSVRDLKHSTKRTKFYFFEYSPRGNMLESCFCVIPPPPLLREEKEGDLVRSRSCVYVFTFRFVISSKLWFLLVTMRIKFYREMFCLKSDPIEIESIFGEIKTNSCFGIRLVKAATKVLRLLVACFSSNINYNV